MLARLSSGAMPGPGLSNYRVALSGRRQRKIIDLGMDVPSRLILSIGCLAELSWVIEYMT